MGTPDQRMSGRTHGGSKRRTRLWPIAATALVLAKGLALGCDSEDDGPAQPRAGAGGSGASAGRAAGGTSGAATSGEAAGGALSGAGGHGWLVAGIGGAAGAGGHGGRLSFDPACNCFFVGFSPECTLPLDEFARRSPPPASSCANDVDYYRIEKCADGTTRHSWLEGGENSYTMVYSQGLVYASAVGHVGELCDVDADVGFISSGEEPASSDCDVCTVCQGDHVEGGAGNVCD